jgi:hypothetical protein
MDNLSLILQSRVTQIRVAQISGERDRVLTKEGTFDVSCKFGLGPSRSENKRLIRLTYSITGLPEKDDTKEPPAFTASIEIRGMIEFPKEIDASDLKLEPTIVAVVCQPLYTVAVQKIASLLLDLGVRNVRLDPDLRTIGDSFSEVIEIESSKAPDFQNSLANEPKKISSTKPKAKVKK